VKKLFCGVYIACHENKKAGLPTGTELARTVLLMTTMTALNYNSLSLGTQHLAPFQLHTEQNSNYCNLTDWSSTTFVYPNTFYVHPSKMSGYWL